jgi:hypothetical protein
MMAATLRDAYINSKVMQLAKESTKPDEAYLFGQMDAPHSCHQQPVFTNSTKFPIKTLLIQKGFEHKNSKDHLKIKLKNKCCIEKI